jgi:hypothetical protein
MIDLVTFPRYHSAHRPHIVRVGVGELQEPAEERVASIETLMHHDHRDVTYQQ